MSCPKCAAGLVISGICPQCGAKPGLLCPKCKAMAAPGERFCAGCGTEITSQVQRSQERLEKAEISKKLTSARKWLLAVSILTFISGLFIFFTQRALVEKQIAEAERQLSSLAPEERDRRLKENIGMTWAQAVAKDRGGVRLLLFINMGLSVIYLGLHFWARKNALVASLVALILFITVVVVSGILEPKSLVQGWFVKIFFVAALLKAVSSAIMERKLYGKRV